MSGRPARWGAALVLVGALALGVLVGPGWARAWVFVRLPPMLFAPMAVPEGHATLSASGCAGCHAEIAEEWAGTRMGQAWMDPVFQADYQREGELYACRTCHTPLYEQQPERVTGLASLRPVRGEGLPNPDFDVSLQAEGVTCVVCHVRDGVVVGSITEVQATHPVKVDPDFGSAALCASCHQAEGPPLSRLKRPVADTVGEWERWRAATGREESCVDCHMPAVERALTAFTPVRQTRSHAVLGGWDDAFVASAIRIDAVARTQDGVSVTITNLAGHNVPTADPMRGIGLVARARVAGVTPASAPHWFERLVQTRTWVESGDTTLLPAETRTIRLRLPGLPISLHAVEIAVVADRLRHADASLRGRFPGESELFRQLVPFQPLAPAPEDP